MKKKAECLKHEACLLNVDFSNSEEQCGSAEHVALCDRTVRSNYLKIGNGDFFDSFLVSKMNSTSG
jgi:hypothetical protein